MNLRNWLRSHLLDLLSTDIEAMITRELIASDLDDVAVRAIADQRIAVNNENLCDIMARQRWGKD